MTRRADRNGVRAVFAVALALLLSGYAAPALADDSTPPDVRDAYSTKALDNLRASNGGTKDAGNMGDAGVPDFSSAARFGDPHQISVWSAELIAGDAKAPAVTATDEWLASVLAADGEVLGTYRVWRPSAAARAEMAGFNNDVELGRALSALPSDAVLVNDAPSAQWLSLDDGVVSALNQVAAVEVPSPMPVSELAPIVAKRYAQAIADAEGHDDAVGGGGSTGVHRPWYDGTKVWIIAGVTAAILAGALGAAIALSRERRRAGPRANDLG
ncbi:hypothetical protein IF188_18065 [Microbacterium sp. NEAU-LLC]|uniref:DUF2167 domain-containing protein n=1 Tax=Microbacterium helvum TaxID=2773713 RepID=A0ABR8NWZ8_9MICO|nr:hypothetical protein [Microbacterium helvum]MBD3943601.1 hypothetical protein [Microbacterium helvum]